MSKGSKVLGGVGLVLTVAGLITGLGLPIRYHGAACGSAWDPTEFSPIQTSITRGCDAAIATANMWAMILVVLGVATMIGVGFVVQGREVKA